VRLLTALGILALAGCGSGTPSPESVVRAWSEAVNSEDNSAAAHLFAENAQVIQGTDVRRLRTFDEAKTWNAALPCSGRILALEVRGQVVRATFLLGNRGHTKCDGPGVHARALFRVEDGKIVLWHQLSSVLEPQEESAYAAAKST
jgi:limonene-1,2-epoxide hydrolase